MNTIAHRIAPMFRQIEAREIGEILKSLEENKVENIDLENLLDALKTKTDLLFKAIQQEIV